MAATDEAQATLGAGAPPHKLSTWHDIDWQDVREQVKRLQVRIVKATQHNRRGKVNALQWLMTHSFSGKAEAVKRVTENHGKRTAGEEDAGCAQHRATAGLPTVAAQTHLHPKDQ